MKLTTEVFGNVVVIHTPDYLGEDQSVEIQTLLEEQTSSNVILDMDGTETVNNDGLEALLSARDFVISRGGELKISTSNLANQKILEITRLDQDLDVFESVIEAVKSFV